MKAFLIVAAIAAMGAGLCGCGATNIQATSTLVQSLAQAGCTGTIHVAVSATTAAMGVPSANLTNTFDGQCVPPAGVAAPTGVGVTVTAAPAVAAVPKAAP